MRTLWLTLKIRSQFHHDVRSIVNVHIVHGSWRKEDTNRISLDQAKKRFPNVNLVIAFMPEAFGTHHSKMIILFRHDELAQVVILTGNFIQRDWNMSQAVWQSPLLPLLHEKITPYSPTAALIGSGIRFKHDLMAYLRTYGTKLKDLTAKLGGYDFRAIKAALIASTPGKQNLRSIDPDTETLWGWPGLKHILSSIRKRDPCAKLSGERMASQSPLPGTTPHVVIQVSSVASIGEKWLSTVFCSALATINSNSQKAYSGSDATPGKPQFSIIFPTADTIRRSIDGYGSGGSIHMKTQTPTQSKQLSALRPMLCHWAGNMEPSKVLGEAQTCVLGKAR